MSIKSAPLLCLLLVALTSPLVAAGPVRADQLPDHHGRVTVENVWMTPANEAGQAILRLRILNETRSPMHLLGVATPLAKDAHLVGRISDHKTARLGSIGIRPGDALDLTTSHLWIDRKSVVEGKSVSVRVDLGGSRSITKKKNTRTKA